ncbi:nucleolar complex protein 2 [Leptinotarsa decemlineata]|uniref:nucleolar complex protein 2 n=1 Tax=Leptinotarsa decemlineata TaxID=7539 RepID=UPI000C251BEA|nr:nucleolar complex protein 2 homolog [Leptinotarsa decemlineata]
MIRIKKRNSTEKKLLKSNKMKSKIVKKARGIKKTVKPCGILSIDTVEGCSNEKFADQEINEDNYEMEEQVSDPDMEVEYEAEKHKRDLLKLQKSDPEFYKFLQENDKKLLDFNVSDEEADEPIDDEKNEKSDIIHKLEENLEVASDESDFEPDEDKQEKDSRVITLKLLKIWQSEVHTDKSNKTITALIQAFHAALLRITSQEKDEEPSYFKVEGPAVFNGVIQLCVLELGPAIRRFLGIRLESKQPAHKCKKFIKIKRVLKTYFLDILKLLLGVTSSNIQTVLLKHLHYMSALLSSYPNVTKQLIKQLIHLWGTADDTVRVLAFFCILRITNSQQVTVLDTVLKSMYMTYVKNCKFVSFKGLPVINFMKRSLVEMYALDTNFSYQHVFLYIRQLAIHLRNAITVNKIENIQSVYNWQFINSLKLWANLLSVTYNKKTMQSLVYPLVQICLGTIKLVPTPQYYPLRFQVTQILMDLGKETGIFIPVLPFLLEVLTSYDFNKKHQKVSMKPLHFTCLLRVSKSQLQENGFKDMIIDVIYGQLLEYLSSQSHTLGFPDLGLICIIQIKQFLKTCKNSNYTRKMKQVIEKIEQNSQFIENERAKLTINITDFKQIEGFETQIKNKGTPLSVYFESWNKLKTIKRNKQLTDNEGLADYNLPTIKTVKNNVVKKKEGQVDLFPSDSEDDEDVGKRKRGKRGGKKFVKNISNENNTIIDKDKQDIVEDIQMDEW